MKTLGNSTLLLAIALIAMLACEASAVSCEPADLNGDDVVDGGDLGVMLAAWSGPGADLNADGTTNGADLGQLLSAWGPVDTSVICLRKTAGSTPAWTNGGYPFQNGGPIEPFYSCPSYVVMPVILTAPPNADVRLKEWRVITGRTSSSGSPDSLYYFELMMWSSIADAGASPCAGTLAQVVIDEPEIEPWGFTGAEFFGGQQPTFEFRFDLEPINIVIPAGESRAVAVRQKWEAGGAQGFYGTMESKYAGPTDYSVSEAWGPPGYIPVDLNPVSLWHGVLAVDVTAVPVD